MQVCVVTFGCCTVALRYRNWQFPIWSSSGPRATSCKKKKKVDTNVCRGFDNLPWEQKGNMSKHSEIASCFLWKARACTVNHESKVRMTGWCGLRRFPIMWQNVCWPYWAVLREARTALQNDMKYRGHHLAIDCISVLDFHACSMISRGRDSWNQIIEVKILLRPVIIACVASLRELEYLNATAQQWKHDTVRSNSTCFFLLE